MTLGLRAERTILAETRRFSLRSTDGLRSVLPVPIFRVQRVFTALEVPAGKRVLLQAFYGRAPDDPVTLFIIRAVPFPSNPAPHP